MGISKRLKLIADLVTEGNVTADIGTDHGYVPIYLLREKKVPKAIAVDISKGPLEKAKQNAEFFHLNMDLRLGDGLSVLEPGEAQTIIIAGMGGILMTNILEAHKEVSLTAKELILSPHRDAGLVRGFLKDYGFEIVYDEVITDKKKSYALIKGIRMATMDNG